MKISDSDFKVVIDAYFSGDQASVIFLESYRSSPLNFQLTENQINMVVDHIIKFHSAPENINKSVYAPPTKFGNMSPIQILHDMISNTSDINCVERCVYRFLELSLSISTKNFFNGVVELLIPGIVETSISTKEKRDIYEIYYRTYMKFVADHPECIGMKSFKEVAEALPLKLNADPLNTTLVTKFFKMCSDVDFLENVHIIGGKD